MELNAPVRRNPLLLNSVNVERILPLIFAVFTAVASAQQSLDSAFRMSGNTLLAAFEPQRQALQACSAVILEGRKEIAYGVVISADGHILTKASEITGGKALGVIVDKVNFRDVRTLAVDATWDVALLKINATGLTPVTYAPTSELPQGTWVVANGASTRTTRRLLAGIISAKIREIPAAGGAALGVTLATEGKRLVIQEVNGKSGAEEAGLQKGDVIVTLEGTKVSKVDEIAEILKDRKAGTMVKLTLLRERKELAAEVRLSARKELFQDPMDRNDQMSGDFSPRRSGFPRVLQHDILGSRKVIGGPLLDLDGRCVGMNIARANRAESFAIPVEDLKALAERLMQAGEN